MDSFSRKSATVSWKMNPSISAKYRDSENRVEELRQEAIAQANRYADTDTVKQAIGSTQLHKIVVVYKGMEMRVCEEL